MIGSFSRDPMIAGIQAEEVPKTAREAIQQVVMANRILSTEGILDALGHMSVRNPVNAGTFFQARSISPFEVTSEDILEIDLDGEVVTQTTMKPYGERIIHGAILKARPEMNAVFHGHFAAVIPFSVTDTPIRPVTHVGSPYGFEPNRSVIETFLRYHHEQGLSKCRLQPEELFAPETLAAYKI